MPIVKEITQSERSATKSSEIRMKSLIEWNKNNRRAHILHSSWFQLRDSRSQQSQPHGANEIESLGGSGCIWQMHESCTWFPIRFRSNYRVTLHRMCASKCEDKFSVRLRNSFPAFFFSQSTERSFSLRSFRSDGKRWIWICIHLVNGKCTHLSKRTDFVPKNSRILCRMCSFWRAPFVRRSRRGECTLRNLHTKSHHGQMLAKCVPYIFINSHICRKKTVKRSSKKRAHLEQRCHWPVRKQSRKYRAPTFTVLIWRRWNARFYVALCDGLECRTRAPLCNSFEGIYYLFE